jgi:hypothetical protein
VLECLDTPHLPSSNVNVFMNDIFYFILLCFFFRQVLVSIVDCGFGGVFNFAKLCILILCRFKKHRYLALRLSACVKAIDSTLNPQKVDDSKLRKLIERAYPSQLNAPQHQEDREETTKKTTANDKGEEEGEEEGDVNVSLLELHWQEAVDCLGELLEAERTARALTKHVYMLWRALLVTREDLGRLNDDDNHDSYGRGGKLFHYYTHNHHLNHQQHGGKGASSSSPSSSSNKDKSDRIAVSSLKLKIVKNPAVFTAHNKDTTTSPTSSDGVFGENFYNSSNHNISDEKIDPLADVAKLLSMHDKLAKTLMCSITPSSSDRKKKSNDNNNNNEVNEEENDNEEDNDNENNHDHHIHKDRIQSKTDSDNRKQFYESRKLLRERHGAIKALLESANDLLRVKTGHNDDGGGNGEGHGNNVRRRGRRSKNKKFDESKVGGEGHDDGDYDDDDNIFDEESNASELTTKVGNSRFNFIMNLTLDGKVSSGSQLSRMLKRRRHRLSSLRVYALLHVNGSEEHVARIPKEGAITMSDVELKVHVYVH